MKTYQTMSRYAVRKCNSINSYICLHLSKATSDFILVLSHKDQAFSHKDFFLSWNALSKAEFVRKTFPGEARTAGVLAGRISKLIVHLSKKAPSRSIVTPTKPGLSRRSLLTDVENVVLWGSPKPVPDNPKTAGKRSGN
jgi:hypothetical protein